MQNELRLHLTFAFFTIALAAFSVGCSDEELCTDSEAPLLCPTKQVCCPAGRPYSCSDGTCTSTALGCRPAVNDDFCS